MIKRISCRVVRSIALGGRNSAQGVRRLNNKHSKIGSSDIESRNCSSFVRGFKNQQFSLGLVTYTRRFDIKAAFGGNSIGRILDYYA